LVKDLIAAIYPGIVKERANALLRSNPVSFLRRLEEIAQIDIDKLIEGSENPEKDLDQVVNGIQEVLTQARTIISRIDSTQNQKAKLNYSAAMAEVSKWRQSLQKALDENNDRLGNYALERLKNHEQNAHTAKAQIDEYTEHEDVIRRNSVILQKKITEAKSKKYLLALDETESSSSSGVIKSSNSTLESELRKIEQELELTKIQLLGQQETVSLLLDQNSASLKRIKDLLGELDLNEGIDDELETLRKQIENLC
jgi:phage shock protein A